MHAIYMHVNSSTICMNVNDNSVFADLRRTATHTADCADAHMIGHTTFSLPLQDSGGVAGGPLADRIPQRSMNENMK